MARRRRERIRLQLVLPYLRNNFVLIRVLVPDPPFDREQFKVLREALVAAGAAEAVWGRVPEAILRAALTEEIRDGRLPEDAQKLAAEIEDITVFCRVCAEDIRSVVKRIEDGIPNSRPLQVEHLFIDYKCFRKEILYLGMSNFKCSSPRHSRHVEAHVSDLIWRELDEGICNHYKLHTGLTGLAETTFEDLKCAVYRLFVNKDSLLQQCRKGDLKHSSPFIGLLLKLLGFLMRKLKAYFFQPEDVETAFLTKLLSFEKNVDILFSRLDFDPDGFIKLFMSNIGIDWAAILEVTVLSSAELQKSLQCIVCGLIDAERAGLSMDRKLLKDSIEILKASSLYETIVKVPYMRSAAAYYSDLSKRLIRILEFGEYVKAAEMSIDTEVQLVREFLDPKVETEIISLIVKEMIRDHMRRLVVAVDSHLSELIDSGNFDDINTLCRLVLKLPDGHGSLFTALTLHIKRTLGDLVAAIDKEPVEYIQLILDERQKFERIIKQSLRRDMRLTTKFSVALREISSENLHLPEYVSLYMDHILAQKATDLQSVSDALDKAVILMGDFDDKSIFQIYYHRYFANRLLTGSYKEELELEMLSKLRMSCCPHFLDKLKTMLHDLSTSERITREFSKIAAQPDITISIRLLRSQFWPKQPPTKCKLPDDVIRTWELFCKFYSNKYSGRKLFCCPSLGNTAVLAKLGDDHHYELSLPIYHTCILLLFNSANNLSFEDIYRETCIPRYYLKKCLIDLTNIEENRNILKKNSNGQITKSTIFCVNIDFCCKLQKLTFSNVTTLKNIHVVFDEDVPVGVDSMIIKMLKGKSAGLSFNHIIKGLTKIFKTKFHFTPRGVQKRLNTLIMWELVEKEEHAGKVFYRYYI